MPPWREIFCTAYNHINNHLASNPGRAMLSWKDILELNLIVHLGTSAEARRQYYRFIKHTEERFEAGFPVAYAMV